MSELMIAEQDGQTGKINIRPMNDAELEQAKKDKATYQAEIAATEAKAQAKAALLSRLGITADEAKLLLGGN
jgi:hypothetical protein